MHCVVTKAGAVGRDFHFLPYGAIPIYACIIELFALLSLFPLFALFPLFVIDRIDVFIDVLLDYLGCRMYF